MYDTKKYAKTYRQKHKEQIKAYAKAYQQEHKEEIKAYAKAYRQEHKEEIKACRKAWWEKNKHFYKYQRKDSTSPTYNKQVLYSVWNNFTDEVVIIDGNYIECANAMGISVNSFYSLVSRAKHGKSKKWTIEKKRLREKRK